jgi:hypothetical protein
MFSKNSRYQLIRKVVLITSQQMPVSR